jgi:parvulin-like peptidyl-prolyl isomerase
MPTAKTTKKTSAAPKKTTDKKTRAKVEKEKKVTPSKSSSKKSTKFKSFSVADLRNKVVDKKNRRSLILAIVVIVVALVIFFGKGLVIAALVNGQPVSRLAIIHDLETQSGKAALDAAVTRMLVFQEADKKNITVTDKEVDNEVANIQKQFEGQGQDLNSLLATQGLTKDKFRDEVKVQLLVTKILGDQVKVTDKEFNDFLAKNKDLIANEKDQNAAKASLRQQMEQQKLAQKYQEWIDTVKKNAKINYFVNY